jgi:hypothetical protein
MRRRDELWARALQALVGSTVATLAVRWAALATLPIPPEFPPLAGPGPTIFFTVVLGLGAIGVYGALRRWAGHPDRLFRRIAVAVLLFSFVPDFFLLSDGAAAAFPGATPAAVGVLMLMHVTAAVVIVWSLTTRRAG